jgi:hypothetical protein
MVDSVTRQIVDLTMVHSKTICRILSLADIVHSAHGSLSTQVFRVELIVETRVNRSKGYIRKPEFDSKLKHRTMLTTSIWPQVPK